MERSILQQRELIEEHHIIITMRSFRLLSGLAFLSLTSVALSQSYFRNIPPALEHYRELYKQAQLDRQQTPMNPGPVLPPTADKPEDQNVDDGSLTISDILPKARNINIFASFTRDISSVAGRLESITPGANTTLLAPLNSAMQALPRKPWEDRPNDNSGVSAQRSEDKAAQNLQRFVEEHIVPTSPWDEGQDNKVATLGGQELWWETRNGKKVIMPGEIVVDGVLGKVGNGEIWALRSVVNYE